ncbi:MAG: enoyl-CoA hydratase/isomerase family protein [Pseudomonadota bacterium]
MSEMLVREIASDGRATITLNRPEIHNAFDDHLIAELTEEFAMLGSRDDVRVIVLAAAGKSFSAGADLNWMKRMAGYSEQENFADSVKLAALMRTLNTVPKPTIAAVQGAAFGGGVGLVSCCDIAVASESAKFCLSEVRLGLIPSAISPYVVAAMGARAARRYFLTAERFDAAEAKRIGLVHEVVASEALELKVDEIASAILKGGPIAVSESKRLIADMDGVTVTDSVLEDTAQRIAQRRASEEGKEGLSAFLEKRNANWVS